MCVTFGSFTLHACSNNVLSGGITECYCSEAELATFSLCMFKKAVVE